MTLYKVVWEIEIDADTPEAAVKTARSWLLDPGAECVVFGVTDITNGNPYPEIQQDQLIDLIEDQTYYECPFCDQTVFEIGPVCDGCGSDVGKWITHRPGE